MENVYYVTESKEINLDQTLKTINPPDIFSTSVKGDVFMLTLSLGVLNYNIEIDTLLKIELINSYHDNSGGSAQYLTIKPADGNLPVLINLSPVEYSVLQDGINPLDQKVVHIAINVVSGHLTKATMTTRSVWQKINWINMNK